MFDLIPAFVSISLSCVALWMNWLLQKQLGQSSHDLIDLGRIVISQDEEIVAILGAIEILTRDLDMIYSQGQEQHLPVTKSHPQLAPQSHVVLTPSRPELNDGLPKHGHMIIIGASGSGKTVVLKSQIIGRLMDGQDIYCVDTKEEIEPIFGQYVTCVSPREAEKTIRELLEIAKTRRQLFRETTKKYTEECANYSDYFRLTGDKMPIISFIVEELIVLMELMDEASLIEMLVICRSAGIFVIALGQYLNAQILSRKGSMNFGCRVYLGPYDKTACSILFQNITPEEKNTIINFVGEPGKAVIWENGKITTRTMPNVLPEHTRPFIQEQ